MHVVPQHMIVGLDKVARRFISLFRLIVYVCCKITHTDICRIYVIYYLGKRLMGTFYISPLHRCNQYTLESANEAKGWRSNEGIGTRIYVIKIFFFKILQRWCYFSEYGLARKLGTNSHSLKAV